jgi:hypothetical protein
MVERILVPFDGEGSGEADLTWGQIGTWQGHDHDGPSITMAGISKLTSGTTIEQIEALRFVVSRHQALRTLIRQDADGSAKQVCFTSGEVPLEIIDAGDEDPAVVAEHVQERYQATKFDYANEWPVRTALIRKDDAITHAVAVYLHTSVDASGLLVLLADLIARDPETGVALAPVIGMSPLEQARRQQTPAAQRQCAASLKYLEHVLRTVTPSRFGEPKFPGDADYRMVRFRSAAMPLAIRAIAARENVNTSSVLLACFAVGLARFTGDGLVMAMLMVSNRFRPGFADSVSSVVQISPYLIDVSGASMSELMNRARISVLNAYKNAYYHPYLQDEVMERVNRERGEEVDYACFYNDRRQQDREVAAGPIPTFTEIQEALPRSEIHWDDEIGLPKRKLYLNVDDPGDIIEVTMSVDTRYFSAADMELIVRGIESVAVEAALDPTASTGVGVRAGVSA